MCVHRYACSQCALDMEGCMYSEYLTEQCRTSWFVSWMSWSVYNVLTEWFIEVPWIIPQPQSRIQKPTTSLLYHPLYHLKRMQAVRSKQSLLKRRRQVHMTTQHLQPKGDYISLGNVCIASHVDISHYNNVTTLTSTATERNWRLQTLLHSKYIVLQWAKYPTTLTTTKVQCGGIYCSRMHVIIPCWTCV